MEQYKSYMDRVTVSDALHEKLLCLEKPAQKTIRWQKYAAAACAVLLVGVGAWRVGQWLWAERWRLMVGTFAPCASAEIQPSAPDPVPCAAPSHPAEGDGTQPGMKTIGGYEEYTQIAGMDVTIFHILPWIDYGSEDNLAALDWALPEGTTPRDLSIGEITALLGGETAVDLHLDWSEYELTGWGAWNEDGSFWGVYLQGCKGPMDHFEFAVTSGCLPPTCIVFEGSVEQDIRGVAVTADKYDGEGGCARRVSFMKDGYGYRFDLTATGETEDAEKLVSRVVAWVADEGLSLYTVTGEEPPEVEVKLGRDSESQPPSPPPQDEVSAPSVPPASAGPNQ